MSFTPTYHERNLKNIAQLGDNTKKKAIEWYKYLIENRIDVLIYETIRSVETQRVNVAKGASQTMKSFHIVGQALDFVPVDGKEALWNGYGSAAAKKAIAKAKALGFEWGGDWSGFVDKPHLQYNYKGYGTDTFKTKGDAISLAGTKTTTVKEEVKSVSTSTAGGNGNIKKFQTFLNSYTSKAKFTKLTVDGYTGPKTKAAAVRVYQYLVKVTIDGESGPKSKAAAPIIEKGSKNTAFVKLIQGMLYCLGYDPKGFDGIFGTGMLAAIKKFQKAKGLTADGIVGPNTFAKLFA